MTDQTDSLLQTLDCQVRAKSAGILPPPLLITAAEESAALASIGDARLALDWLHADPTHRSLTVDVSGTPVLVLNVDAVPSHNVPLGTRGQPAMTALLRSQIAAES